jgi:hypothetical protein
MNKVIARFNIVLPFRIILKRTNHPDATAVPSPGDHEQKLGITRVWQCVWYVRWLSSGRVFEISIECLTRKVVALKPIKFATVSMKLRMLSGAPFAVLLIADLLNRLI